MHGGGPDVKPGLPLDAAYREENLELVEKGCENLIAHIETVRKAGVRPVVCVNGFHTDTEAELELVRRIADEHGALAAVSKHWEQGGDGAVEFAEAVVEACEEQPDFTFLYDLSMPLRERIDLITREVYGGDGVTYTEEAEAKLEALEEDPDISELGMCMVKTHLSLSHDPELKCRPRGWTLPIRDLLVYKGAGFVVPVAGAIKLMPGTASNPAYRGIDVDVETGKVKGLF
jgi:formate--tetrahydrofolate ligase